MRLGSPNRNPKRNTPAYGYPYQGKARRDNQSDAPSLQEIVREGGSDQGSETPAVLREAIRAGAAGREAIVRANLTAAVAHHALGSGNGHGRTRQRAWHGLDERAARPTRSGRPARPRRRTRSGRRTRPWWPARSGCARSGRRPKFGRWSPRPATSLSRSSWVSASGFRAMKRRTRLLCAR